MDPSQDSQIASQAPPAATTEPLVQPDAPATLPEASAQPAQGDSHAPAAQ